jgi:hypothetical protein
MDTAEKVADAMEEEAPEGKEEEARKTTDSALLVENFQNVRAMAEIISPGIQVPTLDAKAKRVATLDALCGLRRRTLDAALKVPTSAQVIGAVRGKALTADTLAKLDCRSVRTLFNGVGAAMQQANRMATARTTDGMPSFGQGAGSVKPPTNADLNKKYADFWAKQNK